jgi:two-component SAPR family response regulator
VYQNDQLIADWIGLKGQCVLKYLVAHRGRPIAKDILMDVLWPDADSDAARRNLHQAVYCLRQTLRRGHPDFEHIQFENDCYLLNPEMG